MAVEARHLNLFSPQFLGNREMMIMNAIEGNGNTYNAPMGYGMPPLSGTTSETLIPVYGSGVADSIQAKTTALKADSGLTYSLPVSRKRSRDSSVNYPLQSFPNMQSMNQVSNINSCGSLTFLGEDISLQIQQQQMEIDRFIAQHTEKVRMEIEDRRKRNSRRIIAAVEEGILKRLRAKEEEIDKIGKLNWALEEKVKSLYVENQIWRELAQTNEATANALRRDLEQVLVQQVQDHENILRQHGDEKAAALIDDAESCCGSNYYEDERRMLTGNGEDGRVVERENNKGTTNNECLSNYNNCCGHSSNNGKSNSSNRLCGNCGKEESCVLLLNCRHLCLCTVCASSVNICPICKSTKTASVHVNLSC